MRWPVPAGDQRRGNVREGGAGQVQVSAVRGETARAAQECVRGSAGVAEESAAGGEPIVAVLCGGVGTGAGGARGPATDAGVRRAAAELISGGPREYVPDGGAGVQRTGRAPASSLVWGQWGVAPDVLR